MSKIRDSINSSPERTVFLDLTSLPNTSSYPVVFQSVFNVGVSVNISSTLKTGTSAVNYSTIIGELHSGGWNDSRTFYDFYHSCYDLSDRAIIKVAFSSQTTRATAVYLRGGAAYNVKSDASITFTGSSVSLGDVSFPVSDLSDTISGGTSILKVVPMNYNRRFVGNVNPALGEVITPTLGTGWTNYGSGYQPATITVQDGIVFLNGLVKQATPANNTAAIFTLPSALVPSGSLNFAVPASVASSTITTPLYIVGSSVSAIALSTTSTLGWMSLSCSYPLI